jgi:hypothetical protein
MRACARTLWGRASPPPKQKMENMEKSKTWKRWKKLALGPHSLPRAVAGQNVDRRQMTAHLTHCPEKVAEYEERPTASPVGAAALLAPPTPR